MKIEEIYNILNKISPFELQESWDNSGLLIGDIDNNIEKVYISLDLDLDLIKSIDRNSLIITHHPLIFKPLKRVDNSYPSNIIKEMIRRDISLISIHTNYDKSHLNRFVVENILREKEFEIDNFFCYFKKDILFDEYIDEVKRAFNLKYIKFTKAKEKIKKVAILVGSGGDLIKELKKDIDCFLTGDLKYHQALEAKMNGINLIDIGHYESEIFFTNSLYNELKKKGVLGIIVDCVNPFESK